LPDDPDRYLGEGAGGAAASHSSQRYRLWRNGLIASPPEDAVAPQAFLVEQDPGTVIEPHFHLENEFQVMVGGSGSLGRHVVEPVSLLRTVCAGALYFRGGVHERHHL
jgi:hypothetical protein